MSDHEKPSRVPACTNCARRKTKCDRESPCSSCSTAKIQCWYTKRPTEKKPRLHSKRYEESLNYISHQLDSLSDTLQLLVDKSETSSLPRSSNHESSHTPATVLTTTGAEPWNPNAAILHQNNNSSGSPTRTQVSEISNSLSSTASPPPSDVIDTPATAVDIVQSLMQDAQLRDSSAHESGKTGSALCDFSQYPELAELRLPEMNTVLQLLALAKTSPQRYFNQFPQANEDDFANLCQKLYFPTQPFTIFAWISANCGLFYLFRDLDRSHYSRLHLTREAVSGALSVCSENIDKTVRTLKLCIDPSLEAVDALICAAMLHMEQAKGALGWNLVCVAARMTIELGYHHLPPGYGDRDRSRKRKLFWYVYSVDKSFAFTFGRNPTIQDYDVTTELPTHSEDFSSKWGITFLQYIDFSRLQFDIYKRLLCAQAQQEPLGVRVERVHEFAAKITQIRETFDVTISSTNTESRVTVPEAAYSINIGLFSILTLLYRELPPDDQTNSRHTVPVEHHPLQFHPECVKAGRAALTALVYAWNAVLSEADADAPKLFITWTSLFIPFMPYIAVLSHQIITGNEEDLALLKEVINIVRVAAEANSAVSKLYKAFLRLFHIAELSTKPGGTVERDRAQGLQRRTDMTLGQKPAHLVGDEQSMPENRTIDVSMTAPGVSEFDMDSWQDTDMSGQDWGTLFNEFDLGLGAESAREMMPWFEQHMVDFSTLG